MATSAKKIDNLNEVLNNLSKAINGTKGNLHLGIRASAAFIKGEAQSRTPVDDGILRNSAFFRSFRVGRQRGPFAVIGYTAEYAPWVHEMPETLRGQPRSDFGRTRAGQSFGGGSGKGFYWDGGENQFLAKAVVENIPSIFNMIVKFAGKNDVLK